MGHHLATFTKTNVRTVIADHGFRVASTDPLFFPRTIANGPITWTNQWQQWRNDPVTLPVAGTGVPVGVLVVAPWLKRRELETIQSELGANKTNAVQVKREKTQYYLEDSDLELCHRLNVELNDEELAAYHDEMSINDVCANAFETGVVGLAKATEVGAVVGGRKTASGPSSTVGLQTKSPVFITVTRAADLSYAETTGM